ncbi:HAMP domain-containing sensor histidine kinase [Pantoea sp. CTOTU46764]|uniref:sensor histidine kinase n=1 Tax=Pantoea sp. CTOTU46764 TaxID=2953854 RepID=UPI00289940D6|nr:HAMP domain-containing sensor histidine kinase [Pantoea sp. CTOTU46764]
MLQAERLDASDLSTESRTRLMQLRAGMKRTSTLVEQLLSLSRAQNGEVGNLPPVESIAVFTVVKQVVSDLLPLAEQKSIDIGVVGNSEASIIARPSELYTLLRNILHNAIQYTPLAGKVDITINHSAACLFIDIEDSGPGIAVDKRERVFDAFYRIEGSDISGSGLGLSIVSAIVTRMKGQVKLTAATSSATGLKVSIALPLT